MAAPPASSPSPPLGSRPGDDWFSVGLASSFPNITHSGEPYFKLSWPQPCREGAGKVPGCKVFHPRANPALPTGTAADEIPIDTAPGEDAWLMREQVLVFRYKGRFYAVDHACPHRAYSLSWGVPFDIEDSGRTLGYGIRCRGHSYAFELTTGLGDHDGYKLGVWEVELRPLAGVVAGDTGGSAREGGGDVVDEREVWVRRKPGPG